MGSACYMLFCWWICNRRCSISFTRAKKHNFRDTNTATTTAVGRMQILPLLEKSFTNQLHFHMLLTATNIPILHGSNKIRLQGLKRSQANGVLFRFTLQPFSKLEIVFHLSQLRNPSQGKNINELIQHANKAQSPLKTEIEDSKENRNRRLYSYCELSCLKLTSYYISS